MSIGSSRPQGNSLLKLAAVCLCLVCAVPPALAKGEFSVRSALAFERDGVYYVDASIYYELNDFAIEALESGVALTFEVRLEVQRSRRWRPDKEVAELLQLYELQYHALSERYIVRNLNSGLQDSFATLYSALNTLGRIDALPVVDDAVLDSDARYRMRLKALLSTRQYPAPLRMLFFWRDQWQLQSEWFEWRLER